MKVKTSNQSGKVVFEVEPKDSTLPPISVSELQLKRILVPVDFSDCSRKAFCYGIHFARQFNAELMLLHVVEIVPIPSPAVELLEQTEADAKHQEAMAKQLAEWRKEAAVSTVKAVTRTGTVAHTEIVKAAHESNTDLIVIGNHGRTGFSRFLTGGTTEKVVRHAPCPVLVIREHEHEFVDDQSL
ncbi:MAG TPA: universal stress protein [Verrucomicrobiae bacterium]|nr:universal stress protein [Verrucomicrobiae bacterium]